MNPFLDHYRNTVMDSSEDDPSTVKVVGTRSDVPQFEGSLAQRIRDAKAQPKKEGNEPDVAPRFRPLGDYLSNMEFDDQIDSDGLPWVLESSDPVELRASILKMVTRKADRAYREIRAAVSLLAVVDTPDAEEVGSLVREVGRFYVRMEGKL